MDEGELPARQTLLQAMRNADARRILETDSRRMSILRSWMQYTSALVARSLYRSTPEPGALGEAIVRMQGRAIGAVERHMCLQRELTMSKVRIVMGGRHDSSDDDSDGSM